MAVEVHSAQASPTTYANLVESHNDYVQQLHAANGMVDQVSPSFKPYSIEKRASRASALRADGVLLRVDY